MFIKVIGSPAPQGSKKFVGTTKTGRGILVESSKAVKPWRQDVREAALAVGERISGPVTVRMTFSLRKPASAPKRRKTWPDKKPDLSKLVRSTEDALTDAGVWEDDARVVTCTARKVFAGEGDLDSLPVPGVIIRIASVEE